MALIVKTGANPNAGAEITDVVPNIWKLYCARIRLVTNATVANRTLALTIDDGTNILWQKASPAVQAASLTRDYLFVPAPFADAAGFDANNQIVLSIPVFPMTAGLRLRTVTTNIQAGDDYAAALYYVNEITGTDDTVIDL